MAVDKETALQGGDLVVMAKKLRLMVYKNIKVSKMKTYACLYVAARGAAAGELTGEGGGGIDGCWRSNNYTGL